MEMAENLNNSKIDKVLDIFTECIKNGNDIENLCEKCTSATIKSHPLIKELVSKIREDTKAIEKLKSKVDEWKKSVDGNNYQKWKTDMGDAINSLETASHETMSKVSHVLASSNANKIKEKFKENEKILSSDLQNITDERAKNFIKVLLERNEKIVDCLKYVHSQLPTFFKLPDNEKSQKSSRKRRKLFIIGEDLSKSLTNSRKIEHLGQVIIKSHTPNSTSLSKSQTTDFRQNLNGYLIDDSEKTEVLLKLKEPAEGTYINLMEFSKTATNLDASKLSATIEINGEVDEDIEIIKITLSDDFMSSKGPEALAIVENNKTGDLTQVPIQIIPMSPENKIHGRIVEIQKKDVSENLEEIDIDLSGSLFNSTFKFDSPRKHPHYATPSRKDRDIVTGVKSQYYTPVRSKRVGAAQDLSLRLEKLNQSLRDKSIDKIAEDVTDKILNAIINDPQHNLSGVSEIEYASLSSILDNDVSYKSQDKSFRSPQRQYPQQNLNDISEIEYANLSSILDNDVSYKSQDNSFRSPQRQYPQVKTPIRSQQVEGILIDIPQTPPQVQRKNIPISGGNLIQFDDESQHTGSPRRQINLNQSNLNRRDQNLRELMDVLNRLYNDDFSSRLKRREKVHDRSLPYRNQKSTNKIMNTSLPSRMPMTSNNASFRRPVQVVPSRIAVDAPVPVVDRPRVELSPMRPQETQKINQALEHISNPFLNQSLQTPATSKSFYGYHSQSNNNTSFNEINTSLPSHLTPKKDKLAPMDRSLMTAWQEIQVPQINVEEEDLQNISDPYTTSMNDEYDYSEELQDVSNPFSVSFNDIVDSYDENFAQSLPIRPANEFLSRFNDEENLENVSFELIDDEKDLFND